MSTPIAVLLADDHAVLRDGLVSLIEGQCDMKVIASAKDAAEATELTRETKPDVAVLDLSLPNSGEAHVVEAVRAASPATRVVVLTMHDELEFVQRALLAGCAAYLVKRSAGEALLSTIREVHAGRGIIHVSLRDGTLRGIAGSHKPADRPDAMLRLSPRESEVLGLLARGHTLKEIGQQMGLAKQTVDTYRARLQEKLGVSGRAELVRFAIDHGLLDNH